MADFETLKTVKYWTQRCIPLVYDNSLSIYQLLEKVINELNKLITNNNILPEYIANMIKEYISSGAIEQVVREILANYILNVKYPPSGITPAVGDGSQDDTAAVQGCIDYASAQGGGAVYLPYGAYSVQSLTLKNNVSLFGFDRYTTRLVLRGGASNPLIFLNGSDAGIYNLTLDGNAGIQVNNINVVSMIAQDILLNNLIIEDGYQLLVYNGTGGHLQMDNIVFGNAVQRCANISGNSIVQAKNLKFTQLSAVSGIDVINIASDGGTYDIISNVACETCLSINGNDNYITGIENGATNTFVDSGLRNSIDFKGNERKEYYYGASDTTIKGDVGFTTNGAYSENVSGAFTSVRNSTESKVVTGNSTEEYNSNKSITINGRENETVGSKVETISEQKQLIANNVLENITNEKQINAGSSVETITNEKEVSAGSLVENIVGEKEVNSNSLVETITGQKKVNSNTTVETITGEKQVNAESSVENITGEKEINSGSYAENIIGQKQTIANSVTETINGEKEINAGTSVENITNSKNINAENIVLNPTEPLTYKKPSEYDENFDYIPFKDSDGIGYDVLVGKNGANYGYKYNKTILALFHDNGNGYPMFFFTNDCLNFTRLHISQTGLAECRDGNICYINGNFYITCTFYDDISYSYDLVIYRSNDFYKWDRYNIDLGISATRTWAPELFYVNNTLYLYFSHEDTLNDSETMRIYRATCTNIDTLEFSNVTACIGVSYPSIDPHLFVFNGIYYMMAKNESTKTIELYTTSDFITFTNKNIDIAPPNVEAPSTAIINNYIYLMFDDYLSKQEKHNDQNRIISSYNFSIDGVGNGTCEYVTCNFYEYIPRWTLARHGSLLVLNNETLNKILKKCDLYVKEDYQRMQRYPDHINIEDLGSVSGTSTTINNFIPKPDDIYCIFDNPTGMEQNTTTVTISSINNNYYRLKDIYIFVQCNIAKTLTFPSYQGTTTVELGPDNKNRIIHLRAGIDWSFNLVV